MGIYIDTGNAGFQSARNSEYVDKIAQYADHLLLVGINYNRDTKQHSCKIFHHPLEHWC